MKTNVLKIHNFTGKVRKGIADLDRMTVGSDGSVVVQVKWDFPEHMGPVSQVFGTRGHFTTVLQ
ncbi:hypothetical protein EON76_07050 [bacterium]|nr:MAG: hypothetical protein EON76_07050 [bacterium]